MKTRILFVLPALALMMVAICLGGTSSVAVTVTDKVPPDATMFQNFVSIESGATTLIQTGWNDAVQGATHSLQYTGGNTVNGNNTAITTNAANITTQVNNLYQMMPEAVNLTDNANAVFRVSQSGNVVTMTNGANNMWTVAQCKSDMLGEVSNLNSEIEENTSGAQVETPLSLSILRL